MAMFVYQRVVQWNLKTNTMAGDEKPRCRHTLCQAGQTHHTCQGHVRHAEDNWWILHMQKTSEVNMVKTMMVKNG